MTSRSTTATTSMTAIDLLAYKSHVDLSLPGGCITTAKGACAAVDKTNGQMDFIAQAQRALTAAVIAKTGGAAPSSSHAKHAVPEAENRGGFIRDALFTGAGIGAGIAFGLPIAAGAAAGGIVASVASAASQISSSFTPNSVRHAGTVHHAVDGGGELGLKELAGGKGQAATRLAENNKGGYQDVLGEVWMPPQRKAPVPPPGFEDVDHGLYAQAQSVVEELGVERVTKDILASTGGRTKEIETVNASIRDRMFKANLDDMLGERNDKEDPLSLDAKTTPFLAQMLSEKPKIAAAPNPGVMGFAMRI